MDANTKSQLVKYWQEGHGLKADGILGPITLASISAGQSALGGVWPVESFAGLSPVVSDGFGRDKRGGRGHLGADIMFRRPISGAEDRPGYTRHFFCPSGQVRAVASLGGEVVRVKHDRRNGGVVKILHSKRWLLVYRHLVNPCAEQGAEISAGDVLGIVGYAPHAGDRGINHLHFEIWDTAKQGAPTRANQAIDPAPYLRAWRIHRASDSLTT